VKLKIVGYQFVKGFATAPVNLGGGGVDQVPVQIEGAEEAFLIKMHVLMNSLQCIPIEEK
jgi:hypothetical protein